MTDLRPRIPLAELHRGRLRHQGLRLRQRRGAARAAAALPHDGRAAARRGREDRQRRAAAAGQYRHRRELAAPDRWPTSCTGRASRSTRRKYFFIMQDAIGRGGSSKPSDGLKGKFPRYRYRDMVDSGYRLITEGLGVGASAAGDRQLDGRDACLDVGRGVSRSDGRGHRAVVPAGRDQRPQLAGPPRRRRGDPPRPGLERRRLRQEPAPLHLQRRREFRRPKARPASRRWRRPSPPPTRSTSGGSPTRRRATPTTSSGRSRRSRTTTPSPTSTRSRPRCC